MAHTFTHTATLVEHFKRWDGTTSTAITMAANVLRNVAKLSDEAVRIEIRVALNALLDETVPAAVKTETKRADNGKKKSAA